MKNNGEVTKHLYQTMADELRRRIVKGDWPAKTFLPSEQELCEEFNASRITVRRALKELTQEGLITRRAGRGTWVTGKEINEIRWMVFSRSVEYDYPEFISSRVLKVEHVVADSSNLLLKRFEPGVVVTRVKILRLLKKTPYSIGDVYLRSTYANKVLNSFKKRRDLLYLHPILTQITGQRVSLIDETIDAVSATGEVAERLELPAGAPVLRIMRLIEDEEDQLILSTEVFQRSDINRITNVMYNKALWQEGPDSFSRP